MKSIENQPFVMQGRVVVRRIGTDTLLVPVSGPAAGGRVYPVNATAECAWGCLSKGGTPAQAAARVETQFEVDGKKALSDCVAFASELIEQRLIEQAG